jgi:tRNA uridine 5-carboxymethylaminomethyl modification enzyme
MMTSRAEHRLVLREDNVLERLLPKSDEFNLLNDEAFRRAKNLLSRRVSFRELLSKKKLVPNPETQQKLVEMKTAVLLKPIYVEDLLRRVEINCSKLTQVGIDVPEDADVTEPVEISIKYSGYISRQEELVNKNLKLDDLRIPTDMKFETIIGLSREEIEKLNEIRPVSVGQATRISGVNPSAVQAIIISITGKSRERRSQIQ